MNQNLNQTRMRSKRKRTSRQQNQRSWQQQTRGNDSFCGIRNDDDCVWGRMKSFFSCYKELPWHKQWVFFFLTQLGRFVLFSQGKYSLMYSVGVGEGERCNRHDAQLFWTRIIHISDVQHLHVRCGLSKVNNLWRCCFLSLSWVGMEWNRVKGYDDIQNLTSLSVLCR